MIELAVEQSLLLISVQLKMLYWNYLNQLNQEQFVYLVDAVQHYHSKK
jgi:hypothetical protein